MLDNAVLRFNSSHVGAFELRYTFSPARGYDLLLEGNNGHFEAFEKLSLASAVKAVWAMFFTGKDVKKSMQRRVDAASKSQQHELAKAHDCLRAEIRKTTKLRDRLARMANRGYNIPTPTEVQEWLVKRGDSSARMQAVLWAVDIAVASMDPEKEKYIKIHPMDGEMFRSVYALVKDDPIDPYYSMPEKNVWALMDVLYWRYVEEIRICTMMRGPVKPCTKAVTPF
jgi:hypothetical protein